MRMSEEEFDKLMKNRVGAAGRFLQSALTRAQPQSAEQATHSTSNHSKPNKKPKYRNTKVVSNGIKFDSQKEHRRYLQLKQMEVAGEISDLRLQVKYRCMVREQLVCTYIADFVYRNSRHQEVVEDVKSDITRKNPVYRIKKKLVKAIFGVDISEF